MENIIENYKTVVLKRYAQFTGRADRGEFWWFVLANFIISAVLSAINQDINSLYGLAVFIPSLAVGFRRLHDTGRSGWYMLLGLIPIVGWIILIIFLAQESKRSS